VKRPFVAIVLGLAVALSASAQIYQWKDKDGKTHFSDMPPPNQPGVQAQTPKRVQPSSTVTKPEQDETEAETETAENGEGGTEPKNAVAAPAQEKNQAGQRDEEFRKRRAAAAEAREKAEKDAALKAQREQECQRARAQYATLNSGQRIALPTESGGRSILDDKERAVEIERAKGLIETFCGKD
jgi:hypothetical protein